MTHNLSTPVGELRTHWAPDPRRYADEPAYRAAVDQLLEEHLPNRGASRSTLAVLTDDAGVLALTAECRFTPDGEWHHEPRPPYRRAMHREFVPLSEGATLP